MGNRTARITQSDLTRYAKGLREGGVTQFRVKVYPDGAHEIIVSEDMPAEVSPERNLNDKILGM